MTKRIDGKARADRLVADVAAATAKLKAQSGITPGLCAVLVGEDPASQVYVRNKGKAAVAAGIASFQESLPATITEAELLALIARLECRRPASTASSCNCRCRSISTPSASSTRSTRRRTRRLPRPECRALWSGGLKGAGALHALWLPDAAARRVPSLAGAEAMFSAARISSASRWRRCCCRRTVR